MSYRNNECDGCFKKLKAIWIPVGERAPDRLCRNCAREQSHPLLDKQIAEHKARKQQEEIEEYDMDFDERTGRND